MRSRTVLSLNHGTASSGEILRSTRCAGAVSCSAVDEAYACLVTTGEDKRLSVWDVGRLTLTSSR